MAIMMYLRERGNFITPDITDYLSLGSKKLRKILDNLEKAKVLIRSRERSGKQMYVRWSLSSNEDGNNNNDDDETSMRHGGGNGFLVPPPMHRQLSSRTTLRQNIPLPKTRAVRRSPTRAFSGSSNGSSSGTTTTATTTSSSSSEKLSNSDERFFKFPKVSNVILVVVVVST